ncbi:hypothetical protein [Lysobacter gummosus]|uniref:hypothetical protein n=1 Tax=Lysobacter gummosus TaxID=262324 RepID=UPI003626963F
MAGGASPLPTRPERIAFGRSVPREAMARSAALTPQAGEGLSDAVFPSPAGGRRCPESLPPRRRGRMRARAPNDGRTATPSRYDALQCIPSNRSRPSPAPVWPCSPPWPPCAGSRRCSAATARPCRTGSRCPRSRAAPATGSAPTPSAATYSPAPWPAAACRWASACWPAWSPWSSA